MAELNEARYYFGYCLWNSDFVFVFGGMNDTFMDTSMTEASNKCLNSIERYTVEYNRQDMIELNTYQKLEYMSHLVAIHIPWDKDRILIVGGQQYNKKTLKFDNVGFVFKFDVLDEKLTACKSLSEPDKFVVG